MADYLTIAAIHILVGFEIFTLGFLNTGLSGLPGLPELPGGNQDNSAEALLIIAFLLYLASAILIILIKGGDLAGNMIALICTLILSLLAAVLVIAGAAIWYDDLPLPDDNDLALGEYTMTLDCTGGVMAAIGGIFLIVQLAGAGGGSTSPA